MFTTRQKRPYRQLKKGEVVMIQSEYKRRIQWPLALVEEVITGKDKKIRLARLKTGIWNNTPQSIYPLEVIYQNNEEIQEPRLTD